MTNIIQWQKAVICGILEPFTNRFFVFIFSLIFCFCAMR